MAAENNRKTGKVRKTMVYLFISMLGAIIICQLCIIMYQSYINKQQIVDLTSKLVAKNLTEYGQVKQMEDKPVIIEKKTEKKHVDPVLGSHY